MPIHVLILDTNESQKNFRKNKPILYTYSISNTNSNYY